MQTLLVLASGLRYRPISSCLPGSGDLIYAASLLLQGRTRFSHAGRTGVSASALTLLRSC